MHPVLLEKLEALKDHLRGDMRCRGMVLGGSLGRGTADEFSDIDVYLLVEESAYAGYKKEFPATCERIFGEIQVWLPELDLPQFVNYAFLFKAGDELLLSDIAMGTQVRHVTGCVRHAGQVLIDRGGVLAAAVVSPKAPAVGEERLLWTIKNFWVYMYLNGKYFRREDVFKMLYVQGVLFQNHLGVLRAVAPEGEWTWWGEDVHKLRAETQRELLIYFGSKTAADVAGAIVEEMRLFSRDARAACSRYGLTYPSALEAGVGEHLGKMIGKNEH